MARDAKTSSGVSTLIAKTPSSSPIVKVAGPAIRGEITNDTNAIVIADDDSPIGTLRFDTTNSKLMVKVGASSWETVTSA